MVLIPFFPGSYPQPPFFLLSILFPYVFVLACLGFVLGYILENVRGRFVVVGSAVFWVLAFVLVSNIVSAGAAFYSMFFVLFADVTYAVRYFVGGRRRTAARVSLGLRNELGVIVAVAVVLVGFGLLFASGFRARDAVMFLLQSCAIALVAWVLLAHGGKHVGLVVFVSKSFVVSFVLTFFLWFVNVGAGVSWVLNISALSWVFGFSFWFGVLRSSLFPVAFCVTAYGVFKKRLPAWLILLSSWYVSIFLAYIAYDAWWFGFVELSLRRPPYLSGGGLILLNVLFVFLAFVAACVFTAVYVWFGRTRQSPLI